ncbi:MAG: flagellar basal body rod protein FlgB [Lachnospiraceae bacterium]|nr:flagellar basal body rod protein FlgB [Lachnospiraceae bacterium]
MLNSNAFNYVDVLDKAADASWTRESLITNNIANVDTVGYKRKDIDFESVLREQLGQGDYDSLDDKINNVNLSKLNAKVFTDYENYSYRLDDNNVDIDNEQVELASEQLKYQTLTQSLTNEFNRMKDVLI